MKVLLAVAAFGAASILPAAVAEAQYPYHRPHPHHRRHDYASPYAHYNYGSGTLINNSNCPPGTQPHVWPDPSGYRCLTE